MLRSQVSIPGYHINELVYDGSRTIVYRGVRENDNRPVVLKLLKNPYPSFSELVQFRNQYTIAKNLNFPGIIQTYSLESFQNGYILVMEDFGGISLKDYFSNKHYLPSLEEFLHIAIYLCDIINNLYHHQIIHKDIKPSNILINPQTKQVKLIDFSIASLLPKETQEIKSPNVLEGTLAYISPEQTGRMNRGIDYRSDFYSLGVTFYELLTGELPFICEDVIEMVHCHIAKKPPKLSKSQKGEGKIPEVISDIVTKLMAKNAEDRYQSALGIKYDLEKCLVQLQTTGNIETFVIAQRDISDRFIIPEKLYGRETEVEQLLAAFERVSQGSKELMLIAGFSGIGKTAVVNEVHKPIVKQRGYFIKGKFDQFNRNIPLSGFVQALVDLIEQLLTENGSQLYHWKQQILMAVGENGQVLIDVIPVLEQIIGMQPVSPELSGVAAQNRFNLLFQKFIQVFAQPEHPLVIFLDDLQWADLASLNLMQLLITEPEFGHLLMIGAYRDSEVCATHPLTLSVNSIIQIGIKVNRIILKSLTQTSLNQLIADTLKCTISVAKPLTKLIFKKTQGNPFFSTQFLKVLHQENFIYFDYQARYWQCDIVRVQEAALTDDVVDFMANQLKKLPESTQNILKLAACIGNQFDLNTLGIIAKKSLTEITTELWSALQEGLILAQSQIYKFYVGEVVTNIEINDQIINYQFLHDRVQQAAYLLIPDEEKPATHLKIGQLLLESTSQTELEEKIFDVVNQFTLGIDLVTDRQQQTNLAELCLIAGRRAKKSTAYATAVEYYKTARNLLANHDWKEAYHLLLSVYTEAIESAYLNTDFEQMEELGEITLQHTQNILDKVPIYETKIQACVAQNQLRLGIDTALIILNELGIDLPANPTLEEVSKTLEDTHAILAETAPLELINLPLMTDNWAKASMRILSSMFGAAYNGCPLLLPLTICQQINLSWQYGNTELSAFAYASYGLIICAFTGAVERSYEFGQLGLALMEKLNAQQLRAKIEAVFNNCIRHWQDPLRMTLKPFLQGYEIGLEMGDLEWAVWCIFGYGFSSYCGGKELTELEQELASYERIIAQLKQTTALSYHQVYHQAVLNLLGCGENPDRLVGSSYNEEQMRPQHLQVNDRPAIYHLHINKLILSYLFGKYDQAVTEAAIAEQYLDGVPGLFVSSLLPFYDSLAQLASFHQVAGEESSAIRKRLLQHQEKLQQWANLAPENYLHKLYLVEAEYCRVLGKYYEAIELYDRAVAGAKENSYIQEEALANELAAKFYLEWGKEKVAASYMQEAYYCYAKWGARAKIIHLQANYSQLLATILQVPTAITHRETITPTLVGSLTTVSNQGLFLDLPTVMKAAQAISGEIELDQLVEILMQMAIVNVGASKGCLILRQDEQWLVVAEADPQQTRRIDIPLEAYQEIPHSVVYSVMHRQEKTVWENLSDEIDFANDCYITNYQPKSVLCTSIQQQGQLIGILYLENNLTVGAFTTDRLQIIQLLTAQAAISLKNAQLYRQLEEYSNTLEEKVCQRTQELRDKTVQLESTLQELQRTQTQLIQSEKMSSLGQLVAGIAHEINNPVSFIHGNISHIQEYIADIFQTIKFYQEAYPHLTPVTQKLEKIDLEFIQEDLPKILKSMEVGSERIREIILSLRTFSRMDEAEFKTIDIHSGIDSTLMILQHRLKATSERPAIQILKDYGELPLISCYAGQLNQVFMHILNNAIDAIEEKIIHENSVEIFSNFQQIKIRTSVIDNNWIEIAIADNGIGMTPEVQANMLNPFFTTKPVGKGTGMGISISYQIITEKHRGKFKCISKPKQGTEIIIQIPNTNLI
ncbi:MAG: AAA family ATPase [Calothrix sp. C42_A2020_038]|nr:AAA family ATPase [Calothrix sp. C42_A2020_038]